MSTSRTATERHEWSPTATIDTGHQRRLWQCTCQNQEWGTGDEPPARCEWDDTPVASADALAQARAAALDSAGQWDWDTETADAVADAAVSVVLGHALTRLRELISEHDPDFPAALDALEGELADLKRAADA